MSFDVTVISCIGGAYVMPCFKVKVQVNPSSDTTGISAARSGRSSLPP
jgi:hypothetical protein